jgi:hypothetical protein
MSVELDAGKAARAIAASRVVIGAVFVVAPKWATRKWIGESSDTVAGHMGARGLGGRDLAIGFGTLWALQKGEPARPWLQAGAIADATDAIAVIGAFGRLPKLRRLLYLGSAVGAAALGIYLTGELDQH